MPHSPSNSRVARVPSRIATFLLKPDPRVATGLLLAIIALLPAEPLFNLPMIALAVLGLVQVASRRALLASPEYRFLCIAFLCTWLPMLASLPDAVNLGESIRKTASFCIYFLAGAYAVCAYRKYRQLAWVVAGVAAICGFWVLDALWQFQTGTNWFGISYPEGARLSGMFYTGRLGYLLASFAPLVYEAVRLASRRWPWSLVLLVPYFVTIALSGSRASWGALVIATVGYLLFQLCSPDRHTAGRARRRPGRIAGVLVATVLAVTLAAYAWPGVVERAWRVFEPRIESLTALWSGDREQIEFAIAYRLSIWETAVNMWSAHWLNGVGPRGFFYAYRDYNPEKDYYLIYDGTHGAAKTPHMQLLEIATETGVIGLMGYVILAIAFLTRLRRLERDAFRFVFPYALVLITALFPFSGHLGFYGVLSSSVIWWTIIVNASAFTVASREATKSTNA